MASFYSSNYYYQDHDDNNQYYNQSYNSYDYGSYQSYDPNYVQSYDHTGFHGNAYQLAPAEPIVGYVYCNYNNQPELPALSKKGNFCGENGEYYDPVTTQFVVSYSNHGPAVSDLDFEEYDPHPYRGGYDIDLTYGKALAPSDDICYPTSKIGSSLGDSSVLKPVPVPDGRKEQILEGEAKGNSGIVAANVIQDESVVDSDEDENDDEEDEDEEEEEEEDGYEEDGKEGNVQSIEGEANVGNVNIVSQVVQEENASKSEKEDEEEDEEDEDVDAEYEENVGGISDDQARNEGENGKEIRRQIPPGYGIEAMDLCEGLFGGYFPCLLKRNQGSYEQRIGNEQRDDYDCWQGTVDYLFGNPNPYGGGLLERGRYGDPMYAYQRHYPQQSISGQVQYGEESSYLHSSRYYYGQ